MGSLVKRTIFSATRSGIGAADESLFSLSSADYAGISWLIQLRWWAALGQSFAIIIARFVFGVSLPLTPLFSIISLIVVSNLLLILAKKHEVELGQKVIGAVLVLDTLLLTLLLHLSGGPMNPFSVLFLVHVTLAAVALGSSWSWLITAFSVLCFGLLFLVDSSTGEHVHHQSVHSQSNGQMDLHLKGMWVAFLVATTSIAYFLGKIIKELKLKDSAIQNMRYQQLFQERLAGLTTLAAGAAHELNTPLGTISLIARELEIALAKENAAIREDLSIIRAQIKRCEDIIGRLGLDYQASDFAANAPHVIRDSLEQALTQLGKLSKRVKVIAEDSCLSLVLEGPGLDQALALVLKNALDASHADSEVMVRIMQAGSDIEFLVEDSGCGMAEETLLRLGEPFFTTKEPGQGMGLGLLVVRLCVERLQGSLEIESELGMGTKVKIVVPSTSADNEMTKDNFKKVA